MNRHGRAILVRRALVVRVASSMKGGNDGLHSRELTILGGSLDRAIAPTGTDGPFCGRLTETVAAEVVLPARSGGHCPCRRQAGRSVESSSRSQDPL
jgi:hypothetical protein